ncbi:MAG: UDP-N-acetylmuramoyl-tripeptide--D-alanyl-D-alanine ligase [Gammaproteobacteria bacterium]|nr:UDP-N-acetylmuramoyl-tripeptide--D-alanyl-D-alanine ligase [Gammaproteobacteria bacterium]
MSSLSLQAIATPLGGVLRGEDATLSSFSTDTRKLNAGDTFIALSGPNHDAHDYVNKAADAGANALIVERLVESDLPQVVVPDARLALGTLARLWTELHQVPIVAVTGSNGKTTVKEMIAAILRQLGPVLATEGNLNNEIGLPLTLLALRDHHQYVVVEMGANHVGEIGYLSRIAKPDVAVITNISGAHLEGFGSIERIAGAKSEIYQGMNAHGTAIVNIDDAFFEQMKNASAHCQQLTFGRSEMADFRCGLVRNQFTIRSRYGNLQPDLNLLGEHNRLNASAAAAAASALDIQTETILAGLASVKPVAGRLQRRTSKAGALVIDDTYNANPASARAAIRVLSEQSGQRVLVLGDMRELGDDEINLHAEVGNFARECGIQQLYTVGVLAAHAAHAFGESGRSFSAKEDLLQELARHHHRSTTFLIKGSRGSRMEDIVDGLLSMRGNGTAQEASLT